ncbi:MAG: thiamine pyrophosphate-dependent dehydrogenase E1 component subunit alpha [Deltaproteobacteria bacterium]|nr:thiamine pyrophosphate-dependent dehydrogenase E1 component subunit alpha [Deltaproteobacteria bacterium]
MSLTAQQQLAMLRTRQTIRRFEERASDEFQAGHIYGVVHCYIGQEAVAVGICSALRREDQIISTHRGHGHCIAKGADLKRMMAELYGRATGYCKGKGGSMHIADFGIGMLGANGIVAGGIPIITGAGLAAQLDGKGRVAVSFFGDGASSAGSFHESLNIAALWKLPVIYVCENNSYGVNMPASDAVSVKDVAERGTAYGMPGIVVDGNDVLAVYEAAEAAVRRARAGAGPTLLECKTYRWRNHTEIKGIPDSRPAEELAVWKEKDPIARLVTQLKTQRLLTDEDWTEMDAAILQEIEQSVAFARESPFPPLETALEDVFAN